MALRAQPWTLPVVRYAGLLLASLLLVGAEAVCADDTAPSSARATEFQLLQIESPKGRAVPGKLFLPPGASRRVPVVILLPGTDGVDERQEFYRPAFMAAGIGTLELDTKTGFFTSEKDRPDGSYFVPAVFGALRILRAMPAVDPDRIALMGWSYGGGITMRAALGRHRREWLKSGERGFAAYIGLYGGCGRQTDLANVPILILVGDKDTYGAANNCDVFAQNNRQASVTIYPGVHHGFDKPNVNKKTGGSRIMRWDETAALDARSRVVDFLTAAFAR